MWRVCLQICHPPGVWWATRAAVWAPRGNERKGTIALLLYFLEGWWQSSLTLKQKDLNASGRSSWRSRGATKLQLSNFLFSTTASVGWYEVLASVHQSYTSSSQASNILNGNSRPEFWPLLWFWIFLLFGEHCSEWKEELLFFFII